MKSQTKYGSLKADMTLTYPDDCIQSLLDQWWEEKPEDKIRHIEEGQLIYAFIPHVEQIPMALVPKGRKEAQEHKLADCEIVPLNSPKVLRRSTLPVAGIPIYEKEVRLVLRAKRRPVLILGLPGPQIPYELVKNKPRWQRISYFIGVPYYGAEEGTGRRSGYNQLFLEKVRHAVFPHFFWEILPLFQKTTIVSVLRFDHIMPIGSHYMSIEPTKWKLSKEALLVMRDWFYWYLCGEFPSDSLLREAVALLREFEEE